MTNEEKLNKVLEGCAELLTEWLQGKIPATGRFRKLTCTFPIYGTDNEGYAAIEFWETGGDDRRGIRFGARRENTDMLVSCYLKTGTNEELIAYLTAEDTRKEWRERIRELSRSVDEHW